MPVKLSGGTLLEMLLGGGNIMTLGKVLNDLLPNPSTVKEASLGVGEAPFQVGHNTVVSGLLPEVVGVLQVQLMVCTT